MASAISGDFGDAVLVLMKSPTFGNLPLSALKQVILEPMDRGQVYIARGKDDQDRETPVAVLSVAKVSDELHAKMQSDPASAILEGDEWKSGDNIWFLYADGPEDFMGKFIAQIRRDHFSGEDIWLRGMDEDGKPVARRLPADA